MRGLSLSEFPFITMKASVPGSWEGAGAAVWSCTVGGVGAYDRV